MSPRTLAPFDEADREQLADMLRLAFEQLPTAEVRCLIEDAEALANGNAAFIDITPGLRLPGYSWPAAADIPRLQWLLGHWLLRGAVTLIAAPGGLGKSSLLVGAALSLASGRPLLRKPVYGGPKRVALWNLEDDQEQLARQIAGAAIAHGIKPEDCGDRLFVASGLGGFGLPPLPLVTATQDDGSFRLMEDQFLQVEEALLRLEIDVLIIDPFVSSHHARENETEVIDRIFKRWSLVSKRCDCSINLVHHTRKTNGEKADIDAVRGSIAGVNAARAVLLINRMTEIEAAAFGLADDERRRMFSVDLGKANRSAPEAVEWYRLESVSLGNGGDEPHDEVGAVMPWLPPSASDGFTDMQIEMARAALGNGQHRADPRSVRWVGHAIGASLDIDSRSLDGAARLKLLLRTWLAEGRIVSVKRRDEAARKEFDFIEIGASSWVDGEQWRALRKSGQLARAHLRNLRGKGCARGAGSVRPP